MRTIEDVNNLIDYVKENPLNFTWTNPKTAVAISTIPNSGNGRFATEDMKKGEVIALLGGMMLTETEYQQIRRRFNFVSGLLVHKDFKIHQLNHLSHNNGSLNHCCDPNATLFGQIMIKTSRYVRGGEELFVDYGTITNEDLVLFEKCECGAPNCRRYITAKDWLSSKFRKFHGVNFSIHLHELINETSYSQIIKQIQSLKKIDIRKSTLLQDELKKYEEEYINN